mgnify:CR=1 FL=1
MSKKILGLLPTFTAATYGNLDKQQLDSYVNKFRMPEIGTRESVSGFIPPSSSREDELISKGGQIGTLIVFCVASHSYDQKQLKNAVDKKVAAWIKDSGGEEKSKSEIKKKQTEFIKDVKREFRAQGKTKIANKEAPILISSKGKVFIGLGPRDKFLEQVFGLLPSAGFSEIKVESYNETVELSVLTQVLNDLSILDGVQVEDPFSPDDFLSISVGEECQLVSSGDDSKERAKFFSFNLENRDEIINHIENSKQASALQFSFRIDDHHIAFTYNVGGGYTGTKRLVPEGTKAESVEHNQAIILSSYALLTATRLVQKLTEL